MGAMFHRTQRTPDAGPHSRLMAYCLYEDADRTAEKNRGGAPAADRLESESVLMIECTIPADATIADWRRSLPARRSAHRAPAWLAGLR
jgi:hypothetical protein